MVGDGVVVYVDDDVDVDLDIYVGHVGVGVERIRSRSFAGSVTPGFTNLPTHPVDSHPPVVGIQKRVRQN